MIMIFFPEKTINTQLFVIVVIRKPLYVSFYLTGFLKIDAVAVVTTFLVPSNYVILGTTYLHIVI